MTKKNTPEETRERLRQKELKNNATGALKDGFNRAENGSPVDFTGNSTWKETGVTILVILVIVLGYFGYKLFFS